MTEATKQPDAADKKKNMQPAGAVAEKLSAEKISAAAPVQNKTAGSAQTESACKYGMAATCRYWQGLVRHIPAGVRRYLLLTFVPALLCLGYFELWASPMYVSEVKFAVKSAESNSSSLNMMSSLFRMPSSSLQDAMVVEEFLRSQDAYTQADAALGLTEHYSSADYDVISRLGKEPTVDEISSFWSKVSEVGVNQDSNVITFRVRAYTPDMACRINEQILTISEALINSMNERSKEDMLHLADLEVDKARQRLSDAQQALEDFRSQHQDLDLKATAEGMQSLIINLESQAAQLRTQIAEQSIFTRTDAPAIRALYDRLAGIEQQIAKERARMTEIPAQGSSINTLASQYENLITETDFARQQLVFAMSSLETARADILSKNLYIVTVAKPFLPDESLYPRPLLFSAYLFIILSLAYGVISLIVAAIKEHIGY